LTVSSNSPQRSHDYNRQYSFSYELTNNRDIARAAVTSLPVADHITSLRRSPVIHRNPSLVFISKCFDEIRNKSIIDGTRMTMSEFISSLLSPQKQRSDTIKAQRGQVGPVRRLEYDPV
jgi:hypothetical protein